MFMYEHNLMFNYWTITGFIHVIKGHGFVDVKFLPNIVDIGCYQTAIHIIYIQVSMSIFTGSGEQLDFICF